MTTFKEYNSQLNKDSQGEENAISSVGFDRDEWIRQSIGNRPRNSSNEAIRSSGEPNIGDPVIDQQAPDSPQINQPENFDRDEWIRQSIGNRPRNSSNEAPKSLLLDSTKEYSIKNGRHYEKRGSGGDDWSTLNPDYTLTTGKTPKDILDPISVETRNRSKNAKLIVGKGDTVGFGLKTAFASIFVRDEEERAEILKGSGLEHEEVDGLHFLTDKESGEEWVVNKAGIDRQDVYDVLSDVSLFSLSGRATSAVSSALAKFGVGMSTAAATQTSVEAGQYLLTDEGEFDLQDILIASAGGAAGGLLDAGLRKVIKSVSYSKFSNRFLKDKFISYKQKESLALAIQQGDLDESSIKSLISESEKLLSIAEKEGLPDPDINDVLSSLRSKGRPVRYLEKAIERGIEEGDSVSNTAFREGFRNRARSTLDKLENTVGSTPPNARAISPVILGKESDNYIKGLKGDRASNARRDYGGMISQIDSKLPDEKGVLVKGLRNTLREELNDIPEKGARAGAIKFALKNIEQDGDRISARTAHEALKTIRDVLRETTGKNSLSIRQIELRKIAKQLENRLNILSKSDRYPDGMLKATDDSYRIASELIKGKEKGLFGQFSNAEGGVKLDDLSNSIFSGGPISKQASVDFMKEMAKRNKYAARAFFENHYSYIIRGARESGKNIDEVRLSLFGKDKQHLLDMADIIDPNVSNSLNSLDDFLKGLAGTEKLAGDVVDKGIDRAVNIMSGKDKNPLFVSAAIWKYMMQGPKSNKNIDRVFAMVLDPNFTKRIKPLLNEGRLRIARLNKVKSQKELSNFYDNGDSIMWMKKLESLNKSYDMSRRAEGMAVSYGQSAVREEIEENFPKTKAVASGIKDIIKKEE